MRNFGPSGFFVPFLKMADEEVLPCGFFCPLQFFSSIFIHCRANKCRNEVIQQQMGEIVLLFFKERK
jgi:hypothetical protein